MLAVGAFISVRSYDFGGTDAISPTLAARGLRKQYGDTLALDGFDLEVSAGSVHALLGPNGAGKSTAVHTLATLTRIEEGEARVAGSRRPHAARAGALGHRPGRPVGCARRGPPRTREPRDVRPAARSALRRRAHACRRAARRDGRRRRGGPQGVHLLRRHAAPARHRRSARHPTGGALPRRADDRARPARTRRRLGRRTPRGRPGHDGAAHDAVPRRGRPARRPDHRDGRRPGGRRGQSRPS